MFVFVFVTISARNVFLIKSVALKVAVAVWKSEKLKELEKLEKLKKLKKLEKLEKLKKLEKFNRTKNGWNGQKFFLMRHFY